MADGLSHGMYLKISKILENRKDSFVSADPIIANIRSRKTKTEIELLTKTAELTEEINIAIAKKFEIGMSEITIQNMFHEQMNSLEVSESWERTGCPAVDAGPEKAFGHIGPSELIIKKGHTLHNDFGVRLHGYCSDIQRMWFFGNKDEIPDEIQHAFNTVRDAIIKASEYIRPGRKGHEVDQIARDHVVANGYDEYGHGLGHQVGTEAHDGGMILGPLWERYGKSGEGIVQKDYVFTLELHVRTKNYGYMSLEEMIVITEDGCRFLIPRQEELICLEI